MTRCFAVRNHYPRLVVWRNIGIWLVMAGLLCACTSSSSGERTRYQLLESGNVAPVATAQPRVSILVMQPKAVEGYDTDRMWYVTKPYQVNAFANNAWMSSPSVMLMPLMIRSLESSHYFYAVILEPNMGKTEYRLESNVIRLQQNFLVKPSHIQLVMQVVLIHSDDNRLVAADYIYEDLPCPSDNPVGGVMAANQATRRLTTKLTHFVIDHIAHDHR